MKVLMFGWEFPPHISGGLGTACYGITKGLAKQKVDVLFVMPSASGDEDRSAAHIINASDVSFAHSWSEAKTFLENVKFLKFIKVDSGIVPYVDPSEYGKLEKDEREKTLKRSEYEQFTLRYGEKYKFSGKYGTNLMEEVSRYAMVASSIASNNQFDVIHAHDWLTYPAGIAAKKVSGKPLVIHVHATEFDRSGEHVNQQVYDIERMGMEAADKVITVSNLTRNTVISRYGINPAKVVTVHNAVDFSAYKHISVKRGVNEKIVTFLGRITFQKGPEYFIEAAAKVLKRMKNVRFVMAGNGDLMNRSIRRVAQLGIADRFHFTGFLRGDEVRKMFSYSDVYIMPSVSEPFGISPLEAMKADVPVIISKQSGVAEVVKYAVKVDFWDIDALADSIYGLLNYPAMSDMCVKRGSAEVEELKWDDAAKRIKDVYKQAIKNN